jgi:hypothetical protein
MKFLLSASAIIVAASATQKHTETRVQNLMAQTMNIDTESE